MANIKFALMSLLITSLSSSALDVKNFTTWYRRDVYDPYYMYELPYPTGDDAVLPGLNCTKIDDNHSNCTVTLETLHWSSDPTRKTCQAYFENLEKPVKLERIRLVAVSGERVAISYSAYDESSSGEVIRGYEKFRVLNMSDCKHIDADTEFNFMFPKYEGNPSEVFLYEDGSFDIFKFRNSIDHYCEGLKCKFTFDVNGKLMSTPMAYLPMDLDWQNNKDRDVVVLGKATKDTYFVLDAYRSFDKYYSNMTIKLVGPKFASRDLMSIKFQKNSLHQMQYYKGMLAVCWMDDNWDVERPAYINCLQYDSSGRKILETSVITKPRVTVLALQNLPGGGLLLAKKTCRVIGLQCREFELMKIQGDGRVGRIMSLANFNCDQRPNQLLFMKIWFGENDDYCVAAVCDIIEDGMIGAVIAGSCVPEMF